MANLIKDIHISNFKSIRNCIIKDCKRINLFIGRPNVGKSNILEALSSFTIPYLRDNYSKSITQLIRLENETELFYNGNFSDPARVETNIGYVQFSYDRVDGLQVKIDTGSDLGFYKIDQKLNLKSKRYDSYTTNIRKYIYKNIAGSTRPPHRYLIPPFGINIFNMIEQDDKLKKEIMDLFAEYRLKLVFDRASQSLKIMQDADSEEIFLVPYNSIADTLQRIIFFKTAVASNEDAVLLFEEPEAHSFPPYISHITQEIIHKTSNQYFIATHSPFILTDFLEDSRDELSVFMVHYDKHETKVRQLSEKELHEIYQFGIDLFTNSESYI
ncbi:AAA family ATPase [Sphingobacterium sp. E70]|uniref:AAA family ATPase n=1 Tax=Sphingobacterium sp. E70 TaxID=2853439 RepID=UPI00211C578D|nr:AAA family ATPase [Sphingobacterium sp. E70]ULT23544.1 AAA family ATPase [Sphingobacterium sp. E70]